MASQDLFKTFLDYIEPGSTRNERAEGPHIFELFPVRARG
jgi:hypothetical protein